MDPNSTGKLSIATQAIATSKTTDQFAEESILSIECSSSIPADLCTISPAREIVISQSTRAWELVVRYPSHKNFYAAENYFVFFTYQNVGYSLEFGAAQDDNLEQIYRDMIESIQLEGIPKTLTTTSGNTFATPTPINSITAGYTYQDESHWYTINVPPGWQIYENDRGNLLMWSETEDANIWVTITEIDPAEYANLTSYIND